MFDALMTMQRLGLAAPRGRGRGPRDAYQASRAAAAASPFDKAALIAEHEDMVRDLATNFGASVSTIKTSHADARAARPAAAGGALAGLAQLPLPRLQLEAVHEGRFIAGRVCVAVPHVLTAVMTLLEDESDPTAAVKVCFQTDCNQLDPRVMYAGVTRTGQLACGMRACGRAPPSTRTRAPQRHLMQMPNHARALRLPSTTCCRPAFRRARRHSCCPWGRASQSASRCSRCVRPHRAAPRPAPLPAPYGSFPSAPTAASSAGCFWGQCRLHGCRRFKMARIHSQLTPAPAASSQAHTTVHDQSTHTRSATWMAPVASEWTIPPTSSSCRRKTAMTPPRRLAARRVPARPPTQTP